MDVSLLDISYRWIIHHVTFCVWLLSLLLSSCFQGYFKNYTFEMKTFLSYYIFKNYKMEHKTIFLLNTTETEVKEISFTSEIKKISLSLYKKWVFRTRLMKRKKGPPVPMQYLIILFSIWALSNHHKNILRGILFGKFIFALSHVLLLILWIFNSEKFTPVTFL